MFSQILPIAMHNYKQHSQQLLILVFCAPPLSENFDVVKDYYYHYYYYYNYYYYYEIILQQR
jgi:hypothetical protein